MMAVARRHQLRTDSDALRGQRAPHLRHIGAGLLIGSAFIAMSCSARIPGTSDDPEVGLPLLVEHSLPEEVPLTRTDTLSADVTIYNRSSRPFVVKFGSAPVTMQAYGIGPTAPSSRSASGFDRPGTWGEVRYLELPSPYTPVTVPLNTVSIAPGGSHRLASTVSGASALPPGEYRLRVCVDLVEEPRRPEGGWQHIRWCSVREPRVIVTL